MSYRDSIAQILWAQQNHQCYYCGQVIDWHGDTAHIDHKQPRAKGGSDEPSNLCITCTDCNLAKSSLTEEEFENSLVLRYAQKGATITRDPFGKIRVRYASFDSTTPATKCVHGVYDPDDLSGASNFCTLCSSVCPPESYWKILELKCKLAKGGLVDTVLTEIKALLTAIKAKWRIQIDYWWNRR